MSENTERPPLAYLAFYSGPLTGRTYPITQTTVTLGRASSNDVVIADLKVSRIHARLSLNKGSWQIERLSRNNSIKVEQKNITQATLEHNRQLELGDNVSFHFLLE